MSFGKGALAVFFLNGNDMTTKTDDVSLSALVEKLETTCLGATAKAYIPGIGDGSVKLSGKWDATVDGYLEGAKVVVAWYFGPAGSTTGYVKKSGNGFLTNIDIKTAVGGVGTWSADFCITGGITTGVFP